MDTISIRAGMPSDRFILKFDRTPAFMCEQLRGLQRHVGERRTELFAQLSARLAPPCDHGATGVTQAADEDAIRLINAVGQQVEPLCATRKDAETLNIASTIAAYDAYIREIDLLHRMFEGQPLPGEAMQIPFGILHFAMERSDHRDVEHSARRFVSMVDMQGTGVGRAHLRQAMPGGMGVYTEHGNHLYERQLRVDEILGRE